MPGDKKKYSKEDEKISAGISSCRLCVQAKCQQTNYIKQIRILTSVACTELTAFDLYSRPRCSLSHADLLLG